LTVVKDYPASLMQMERMAASLPPLDEELADPEAEERQQ
jgi:hypothetical protein